MASRGRALLVPAALLAALFLAGLVAGYVYSYAPVRDTVAVRVGDEPGQATAGAAPGAQRSLSGTVSALDGGRLVLGTASGPVTLSLPPETPTDELVRASTGLADGTRVNVGVQATQYGLVVTGIVAVEGAEGAR